MRTINSESEKQYDRAVKMRTMLEGYLERDRSLSDYQQTVLAFRKVYLITSGSVQTQHRRW